MSTLERKPREWVTVAGREADGTAIRFLMRPATNFEFELAVERASQAARKIAEGEDTRALYALDELPPEIFGDEDEEPVIGVSTTLVATELAMICATDWQTPYSDDQGKAYPFIRRWVARVMTDWVGTSSVGRQFQDRALAPVYRARVEGKPSAVAPNGTGAAAGITAKDAGPPATPAPADGGAKTAAAARPSKTRRKQPKA